MSMTRQAFSALLAPDLRKVYVDTGKEYPREYVEAVNIEDMNWNPETDRQISGLGAMGEKPEGSQFNLDQPILGGTKAYLAIPYGLAIEVTWEMWRDELYGIMAEMVREMARSSRNREEVAGWDAHNNAFSTSYVGFTAGESLCSTAHVSYATGVTQANRPTTEIGFSVTGIQNSLIRFHNLKNERGLPMLLRPTVAIVSPTNVFIAREILGSSSKPYTADNEINALIQEDLRWMVSHYKTNANHWHLQAKKGEHDINFRWRDRPMFDNFDDPWTKNAIFTCYQRHTVSTFGSWRGIDGSTG